MAAPKGMVRLHQDERGITLRVEGLGTMCQSLPLRRYLERCLDEGATALRVELAQCTYMDSTFLGTLLFLKRRFVSREQGQFELVSPSPPCLELLQKMHLEGVFPITTVPPLDAGDWKEIQTAPADDDSFKHNVVTAHQELAKLEGPAGKPFRALAQKFADELGAKKP